MLCKMRVKEFENLKVGIKQKRVWEAREPKSAEIMETLGKIYSSQIKTVVAGLPTGLEREADGPLALELRAAFLVKEFHHSVPVAIIIVYFNYLMQLFFLFFTFPYFFDCFLVFI